MSKVLEARDQNFEKEVLGSDLPTEVEFWFPWYGPCMMISPICDKLSEEYDGRCKFCKVNVDEDRQTAMKYQIMSIPMQMFFSRGEKVDEILGAVPEFTIRAMVEDIINGFPVDETGRLKVLLTSWFEHNRKHSEKFSKWMEIAKNMESNAIYSSALQAAQEMDKASEHLSQVLTKLQGYSQK